MTLNHAIYSYLHIQLRFITMLLTVGHNFPSGGLTKSGISIRWTKGLSRSLPFPFSLFALRDNKVSFIILAGILGASIVLRMWICPPQFELYAYLLLAEFLLACISSLFLSFQWLSISNSRRYSNNKHDRNLHNWNTNKVVARWNSIAFNGGQDWLPLIWWTKNRLN